MEYSINCLKKTLLHRLKGISIIHTCRKSTVVITTTTASQPWSLHHPIITIIIVIGHGFHSKDREELLIDSKPKITNKTQL